jgi:hypothetical protein
MLHVADVINFVFFCMHILHVLVPPLALHSSLFAKKMVGEAKGCMGFAG